MASGATVLTLDDCVIKVNGGERIDRQAEWLENHQGPGVVKLLGRWHGGYAMEKLEVPRKLPDPETVIDLLKRYVWRPTTWNCDWDDVILYAQTRAAEWWPEIEEHLTSGLEQCASAGLAIVETHGDPTFENVLVRGEQWVLIDPIPPEDHLPSLLALDLGKILQSWCGYEGVLHGGHPMLYSPSWIKKFKVEERRAARIFALYHIVRLLPYLPNDQVRRDVKEIVGGNVQHLSF